MNRTCVVTLACIPFAALALWLGARPAAAVTPVTDKIDFNRDIRPILSENCYACHGPDKNKRKADLRLDTKGGLFDEIDKGVHAVIPGKPADSDLYRRIITDDADDHMPPAKSNKKLSAEQVAKFKRWIDQGAPWEGHWAYTMPKPREIPTVAEPTRNEIDNFVLDKLHQQGIAPGKEADKITLCRRVYFDLLGLPPTPQQTSAFLNDTRPDAYERLVDQLLASPHFGERMAVWWLDQVRYADTIGYHSDNPMNVWPYRDWVVQAFNQNMPFDEFTIEQLAGDLLPNATVSQKVASCYNRLLQTTGEGGAQPKEYIAKYAADRVRNFSAVWMAQTMGCCECHDHKFDPIATREFYNLESFFADVQEAAVAVREPGMPVPNAEQESKLKQFDADLAAARAKLAVRSPQFAAEQANWEQTAATEVKWHTLEPAKYEVEGSSSTLKPEANGVLRSAGPVGANETYVITAPLMAAGVTALRLEVLADDGLPGKGPGTAPNGNFVLSQFAVSHTSPATTKPANLALARAGADWSQDQFPVSDALNPKGAKQKYKGWAILPQTGKSHEAAFELKKPASFKDGASVTITLSFASQYAQHSIGKLRLSYTTSPNPVRDTLPAPIRDALTIPVAKRTPAQRDAIANHYASIAPELQPARDEVAKLEKERTDFDNALPKCLVSTTGPRRTIHVLPRGNWLDETGAVCSPGVPAVLNKLQPADPKNPTRLDLAHWVVSKDNPLTARVFVNRLWKTFYGAGIARKLDDFGSQGDWPTHPELLDWLALKYEHGWDTKALIKLMVTSRTYRETSVPTSEQLEKDPSNLYLSHQARFRLDAEFVRDNALAISGLLVDKLGGRPDFPYQPAGYWSFLNFPPREWQDDKGEGLYRRGLYTHWQRTFLQPSLLAFDAPSREEAVCERTRSNVPQQALAMLNDVTYVEASRVFAEHILQNGSAVSDRLEFAFRQALQRPPKPLETEVLTRLFEKHLQDYSTDEAAAKKLIAIGDAPAPANVKPAELAAWTNVARAILNLHETITRN